MTPSGRRFTEPISLYLAFIFAVWLIVYVPGLFHPPLLDDADSQHAEAAREMVVRGDYVTLHDNGVRYLFYAPLPYWLMAGSYQLFGVSEWSARLPFNLLILGLFLATFSFGRRVYGDAGGFFSALVLATSFGPYIFTRTTIPDIVVGLWVLLALSFFFRALEEEPPSRLACWGLAATVALNVLTKGLIGVVFPVAIIGIYLVATKDLRRLLRMRLMSSSIVFLTIATPWHILAALRNPPQGEAKGFLWEYFLNEQFYRYLNKRIPHDYGKVPLFLFWGLLLVWLLPWSAFLPQSLGEVPHRLEHFASNLGSRQRGNLLFGIWFAVIMIFFSFSSRQEYYVMPAVPALALLIGGWLGRESEADADSPLRRSGKTASTVLFSAGFLGFVTAVLLAIYSPDPPPGTDFSALLQMHPGTYKLAFGHFFDLNLRALGAFRGLMVGTGCALLLGTGLNWLLRRRGLLLQGNLALAAMMCAILFLSHLAFGIFYPVLGSKPLAMTIKQNYKPGEVIMMDGEYSLGSSVNFYTGVQLHMLNGRVNDLWYGSLFPDSPPVFDDDESFARLWAGPERVYFVTSHAERGEFLSKIGQVYELARSGGKFVFTNRPPDHRIVGG